MSRFHIVLAAVLLFALAVPAAPVHVWEPVEITLRAANNYGNPYTDAAVWVNLKGPGFSKRCPGYWDGGNVFRVRAVANAPGSWTWSSGSVPEDAGLTGQQGAFEAVPWTEAEKAENPNRRGFLKIAENDRYFEYADGTPFFLLADTLWAANTARCGLGENEDGPFFQYLADRKAKGFTAVLMQRIHGFGDYPDGQGHANEGGYALENRDPFRINPAYFQAEDQRMAALSERGFVAAVPTMWWGKTKQCVFTADEARRMSVYCAARYGSYNALWALSGEYQYAFRDCGWKPLDFTVMGTAVQANNPWEHPLSIHPSGGTNWDPPHNVQSSLPFRGESWIDHHWLQTGQSVDRQRNIVTRLEQNRGLAAPVPVFVSEACYETASDPESAYHARWQVWVAFLNGAAGYGYGAHGVWQFLDPSAPEGEQGKMTPHPPVPWREAIALPGSAQVGHARTLLTQMAWERMQPRWSVLRLNGQPNTLPGPDDLTPPQAASNGKEWVIYVPRGNQSREISVLGEVADAQGRWFNPRTGAFIGAPVTISGSTWTLPPRPKPAEEDWVFAVR